MRVGRPPMTDLEETDSSQPRKQKLSRNPQKEMRVLARGFKTQLLLLRDGCPAQTEGRTLEARAHILTNAWCQASL